ncbi:FlgD immunoglobulin-like domain containing protein [Bacteroidota bacterium]
MQTKMIYKRLIEKITGFLRSRPLTAALIAVLILAIAFSATRVWASYEMARGPGRYITDTEAVTAFNFNPFIGEKGTISYTLAEEAKVRVRLVDRDDPELVHRVLISYEQQEPGVHNVEWDGKDASGNYLDPTKVRVHIQGELTSTKITRKAIQIFSMVGRPYGHLHRLHEPDKCGFYTIVFRQVEPGSVLTGKVQLIIEVIGSFRGYAEEGGVGIRGYVDKTLVLDQWLEPEDVRAKFPFLTWTLDTSAFPNSEHTLRLSMCDHNDHPGVASLKAIFQN